MFIVRLLLLASISAPSIAAPYFIQCYDFGCKSNQEIRFSESQWDEIKANFNPGQDSDAEKQAIRQAIATMEKFSGEITGTSLDKGGNYPGYDIVKQMDCIDESTNTFQYLAALEELKLLNRHRVEPKIRRTVWFSDHWTAVISEVETGDKFAVDSWILDNGELPYIQPLAKWKRKRSFTVDYNPELASR